MKADLTAQKERYTSKSNAWVLYTQIDKHFKK